MRISNSSTLGEVFTQPGVVSFMLDQVDYTASNDLSTIKLLEPSAGDGEFIVAALKRLRESSINFQFSFSDALKNIYAVEIDEINYNALIDRLFKECNLTQVELKNINLFKSDFLFLKLEITFDIIIGNPPYVRWDNLDQEYRKYLKDKFKCVKGRTDLYIAFYERCLGVLKKNGFLNFICSNRWFKSAYGKYLRKLIREKYSLSIVIDLEKANPFRSDVLGYPAITLIKNSSQSPLIDFYSTDDVNSLISSLDYSAISSKTLNADIWSMNTYYNELYNSKYYCKIEENCYSVKIGIATGKDAVFIRDASCADLEKDRMIPIIMSKDLNNHSAPQSYVINCFDKKKRVVNLNEYPLMKTYLEKYEDKLRSRHVAKKNPNHWFRTIDKIRYSDIDVLKILLPDISGTDKIKIGGQGYYPHHNLYYITSDLDDFHLKVLAGVLSSRFIKNQLELVSNKMNGGYPRWQSQNIKRLVIPNILSMNDEWKLEIVASYFSDNQAQIDSLLQESVVKASYIERRSMLLFEPEDDYA
ncbi:MAG: N-6 DNA methylase [Bacteroidota bacterium]